jgi:hypothetical protein
VGIINAVAWQARVSLAPAVFPEAALKTKQYYLERARQMERLAKEADSDDRRMGYFKAAEAYEALAKAAGELGADVPDPGKE